MQELREDSITNLIGAKVSISLDRAGGQPPAIWGEVEIIDVDVRSARIIPRYAEEPLFWRFNGKLADEDCKWVLSPHLLRLDLYEVAALLTGRPTNIMVTVHSNDARRVMVSPYVTMQLLQG